MENPLVGKKLKSEHLLAKCTKVKEPSLAASKPTSPGPSPSHWAASASAASGRRAVRAGRRGADDDGVADEEAPGG